MILFLIWKIFESIDHRCHGFSEAKILRKFKHDLQEQYGKINKIHALLNETTLTLNKDHIAAMKVKSLIMLSESFNKFLKYKKAGITGPDPEPAKVEEEPKSNVINIFEYKKKKDGEDTV